MVKILATFFMVLDHIGLILYPASYWFRIIGRLAMPLFAYSIARGFYFTERKGTTTHYMKNLLLFAIVSQIPFSILSIGIEGKLSFNIGFTWLLSVLYLKYLINEKRLYVLCVMSCLIFMIALIIPIDYGIYGVLYPSIFYLFMYKIDKPQYAFVGMSVLYAMYVFLGGGQVQAFSLLAYPVLMIAKQYEDKLVLPRRFFYWFYPVHISVLLLIAIVIKPKQ